MVGSTELESVTSCVSSRRSNQLSYEPGRSGVAVAACNGQDNMTVSTAAILRFTDRRQDRLSHSLVGAVIYFERASFARRHRQNQDRQGQEPEQSPGRRNGLGRGDK